MNLATHCHNPQLFINTHSSHNTCDGTSLCLEADVSLRKARHHLQTTPTPINSGALRSERLQRHTAPDHKLCGELSMPRSFCGEVSKVCLGGQHADQLRNGWLLENAKNTNTQSGGRQRAGWSGLCVRV